LRLDGGLERLDTGRRTGTPATGDSRLGPRGRRRGVFRGL